MSFQISYPWSFSRSVNLNVPEKYPIQEAMSFSPSFVPKKEEDKKQLDKALANPLSPTAQVKSLETTLSLTYADIKDTINNNLAFKENQAVNRIRENSKYFFSYAKKFSKQKQSIPMLFDENNSIC